MKCSVSLHGRETFRIIRAAERRRRVAGVWPGRRRNLKVWRVKWKINEKILHETETTQESLDPDPHETTSFLQHTRERKKELKSLFSEK